MLGSRLYWKVLGNFGFLLLILTAMTILTLNLLSQIESNFRVAADDARVLGQLEHMRNYLREIPDAANDYLLTGSTSSLLLYKTGNSQFDANILAFQESGKVGDASEKLRKVRELFYSWMHKIGDRKIALRERHLTPQQLDGELGALKRAEYTDGELLAARAILREIYLQRVASHPFTIESAAQLSSDLGGFIGLINVLVAVFAVALGLILTRSIVKPVTLLKAGTQKIMAGEFEQINLHRTDELGELAQDFSEMSVMLGNNYRRLSAYSELITALNTHASVEEVQTLSLELLCQYSNASVGAIYILDDTTKRLTLAAGFALKEDEANIKTFALGEGIPGQCALQKTTLEVSDVSITAPFKLSTGLVEIPPAQILAMPILFHEKVLGVLVLGSSTRFTELQKEIITNSLPQIGVAITNARNFEATQNLSIEIATKNNELNQKNRELGRAYKVKSDFLASMSHELRTPLNSIIGFSSVLLSGGGDPVTPDQQKALEKILKNGKHLLQLINDILDFSKLEANRMTVNVEPGEIHDVIGNSLTVVESITASKKLDVKVDVEPNLPLLNTDILKVKQILVNLLSNAAKFTEKGSISIAAVESLGNIIVSVTDFGIGIDRSNLERVFEEFQQIDGSNTRKYQGTGLGLPISRRLARLLGGDLTVKSELGKGSTFILTLPPVFRKSDEERALEEVTPPQPSQPQEESEPAPSIPTAPIQVLCIDDDPDVIEILKKYLVPEGYSVAGANSGDEGIRLASELKPSLITLDIMMPTKDGWQVLQELKRNPVTRDIPVIIHSVIDNKPLAISLGAIDVMSKPVDANILLRAVEKSCKSKDEFVLIVDDNQEYARLLKHLLERDGFNAKTAGSGEEALQILESSRPAIILLDLVMPGMGGIQVVRRLEQKEEWRNIPIIVLSGKELTQKEREELDTRIQHFMKKAEFSGTKITHTIKRILDTTHAA